MDETRYSFSEAEYQALMAKADECADFERRLAEDVANLTASLAAEVTESEALRAALASAQQEKAETLALLGEMREALVRVRLCWDARLPAQDAVDAVDEALSRPAPAALEAMRNRVLEEAAERCKIGPSDEWSKDCRDGYALAALEIENAIRAMKREGEG
ncbi:MAG: hypothetical protein GOVbin1573_30 [Prokaryotic dsDNA virus sp.]|nr:MAG: hypothetical protein GOVbin1573_30 [Prokaryotic dsDNA virus sp.]|tara:strand:- start:764 stop:1243 length:480 start_codon:yes stop_codon:yes gene_type:complete